jgi:hypothetical protein
MVPGRITPSVQRLLDRLVDAPVAVSDPAMTLLLANPMYAALMGEPSGLRLERNDAWRNGFGPVPQTPPGRHSAAADLFRRNVSPAHAFAQHVDDATERSPVICGQPPGIPVPPGADEQATTGPHVRTSTDHVGTTLNFQDSRSSPTSNDQLERTRRGMTVCPDARCRA